MNFVSVNFPHSTTTRSHVSEGLLRDEINYECKWDIRRNEEAFKESSGGLSFGLRTITTCSACGRYKNKYIFKGVS